MNHYKNWRPEYIGLLIAFLALNLWYLSSMTINNEVLSKEYTIALQLIFAVSGPFFGIFFANKFHYDKLNKDTRNKEIVSIRKAVFILRSQMKAVKSLKKILKTHESEIIDTFKAENPNYPLNKETLDVLISIQTKASPLHKNYDYRYDFNSIDFLLDDNAELLFELSESEVFFHSAVQFFNERSAFHSQEVQPRLELCHQENGSASIDQIKKALGVRVFQTNQAMMRVVNQNLEGTMNSLEKSNLLLMDILTKRYPMHSFSLITPKKDSFTHSVVVK
jgi:hypothetical protein